MNFTIVAIVIVLCFAIYFSIKPISSFINKTLVKVDLDVVLVNLKGIALTLGDDEVDKITIPVFAILMNTLNYAESIEEDGIIDFDDLIEFVMNQLEIFEIHITEDEEYLIDIACEVIASYIFNKRQEL